MTFGESISTVFNKYATFKGCASRSEYWWWYLFVVLLSSAAPVLGTYIFNFEPQWCSAIVALALFVPNLAVAVRRCHDSAHSGWWLLCPIYNIILMFYPSK